MTDDPRPPNQLFDDLRRDRELLAEKIRQSKETIERSMELIRRIDRMLAKEKDL